MQKFLIVTFVLFCFASCKGPDSTTAKTDDMAQKNLAGARTIAAAFESGNTASLDSVVADDFLDHRDMGDIKGKDSLKALVNMIHNNMKDMKMETIREVGDDEYVFQLMRYTGSSEGSIGMPAGPYDMNIIEVSKFKDGKAVEHWAYKEMKEMMPPQMPMPADKMMNDSSMKK